MLLAAFLVPVKLPLKPSKSFFNFFLQKPFFPALPAWPRSAGMGGALLLSG